MANLTDLTSSIGAVIPKKTKKKILKRRPWNIEEDQVDGDKNQEGQPSSRSIDQEGQPLSRSIDQEGQPLSRSIDQEEQDLSRSIDQEEQDLSRSIDQEGQSSSRSLDQETLTLSQSPVQKVQLFSQLAGIKKKVSNDFADKRPDEFPPEKLINKVRNMAVFLCASLKDNFSEKNKTLNV